MFNERAIVAAAFYCCDRHHGKSDGGEKSFLQAYTLWSRSLLESSQAGTPPEVGTEAETIEKTLLTACPLTHSASCCAQPSSFSLEMAPPRGGWVLSGRSSLHRWSCDPGNPSAEVPSFQVILGWVKLTETTQDSGQHRTSMRFCRSVLMESGPEICDFPALLLF